MIRRNVVVSFLSIPGLTDLKVAVPSNNQDSEAAIAAAAMEAAKAYGVQVNTSFFVENPQFVKISWGKYICPGRDYCQHIRDEGNKACSECGCERI